jgi:hypothetical protein
MKEIVFAEQKAAEAEKAYASINNPFKGIAGAVFIPLLMAVKALIMAVKALSIEVQTLKEKR